MYLHLKNYSSVCLVVAIPHGVGSVPCFQIIIASKSNPIPVTMARISIVFILLYTILYLSSIEASYKTLFLRGHGRICNPTLYTLIRDMGKVG